MHSPLGLTNHLLEKANVISDCLEEQFTPHDLGNKDHKQWVMATFQAMLKVVDNSSSKRISPWDIKKLINLLKLGKACGTDSIPNKCLRYLLRRPLEHSTRFFNCIWLSHFLSPWKKWK
jgi:hypothetical protein